MNQRVVSLVPSATETLTAWGVVPIAVSKFCERPDITTVGGTKNPDVEAIIDLRPDLIVLCDQENRLEDHQALVAAGVPAFVFSITALAHVEPELARLRLTLGLPSERPVLTHSSAESSCQVSAWVPIWRRPWMTINADTYASTLLAAAGIHNICAHMETRYPEIELDTAKALSPDLVLAPSEPYHFTERHTSELSRVAPVRYVDGKDLFWWGVRTEGALQRLSQHARPR